MMIPLSRGVRLSSLVLVLCGMVPGLALPGTSAAATGDDQAPARTEKKSSSRMPRPFVLPPAPEGVVIERDVVYLPPDRKEKLDLYLPANRPKSERSPAVVIIHGGGWTGGDKSAAREFNICTTLAKAGYVCASVEYLKEGVGRWPTNVLDCKNAVRFLRANAARYQVDVDHIGVIGGSAGGHLALMVAYTHGVKELTAGDPYPGVSDRVQACVDMYGITDLLTRQGTEPDGTPNGKLREAGLFPAKRGENPQQWKLASPVCHISRTSPPTLILHGEADTTVDRGQAVELDRKLAAQGVEHQLILIPGVGHTFDLQQWRGKPLPQDLRPVVVGFFDKHLKPATVLATSWNKELLAGPRTPEDLTGWLAGMRRYRQQMQEVLKPGLGGLADPYEQSALRWARRSFIQPQMMAHERYFYDPSSGQYTVDRYLDDLEARYGGIDSVLVWPTYPNIGIDNRNQFDLWRDMPGGWAGVRQAVTAFHRRGVHVLFPIMFWDHGTRDEGVPMAQRLAEMAKATGADGLNGDTMSPVTREFYTESLKVGHPLVLEPENGLADQIEALSWNVLSWGYWWPYQPAPAVDRYKFLEPRHLTHVCDRWAHDRTDMLQYAFFNGDGYESWENVWGIWNQITPRDAEALRRISAIYRALPELVGSQGYEPFTPTLQAGVYATRFPGRGLTLLTLINRTKNLLTGAQIQVPFQQGARFFDLWRGTELRPEGAGSSATLAFEIEPRGYGAVLAARSSPSVSAKRLLAQMALRAHIKLANVSSEWKVLPQQMVTTRPMQPFMGTPEGMVFIPAGSFYFASEGVMIEKSEGVGVQYPWEDQPSLKHKHVLQMKAFYIDRTPVTCAQFKQFLDATDYRPRDSHNFLRDWTKAGAYPEGWARKPVTWVSLEDARAYAQWAGKRLPHEWEWQYAAQGTDGRLYPWGNEPDPKRVPPFESGRDLSPPADVDAYPQGASPFGVLDLVGNVWQWTDEYQDPHTRAAVLKGGSHYRPEKSHWYFPQARQLNQHGKYLLLAPSIDRSACIGFRCVADAP